MTRLRSWLFDDVVSARTETDEKRQLVDRLIHEQSSANRNALARLSQEVPRVNQNYRAIMDAAVNIIRDE